MLFTLRLPRFRIRRPNELNGPRDHVPVRLERSHPERLVDVKKRALEALDGRLRAVPLILARRAHGREPPDELDDPSFVRAAPAPAPDRIRRVRGVSRRRTRAPQGEHERFLARTHERRRVLGLCARGRRARDEVERQRTARVPRLLVRLAHGRRGHVLAAVFTPFGQQPFVPHRVAQKADLERRTRRGEEDGAAADKEVGGRELVGGIFG